MQTCVHMSFDQTFDLEALFGDIGKQGIGTPGGDFSCYRVIVENRVDDSGRLGSRVGDDILTSNDFGGIWRFEKEETESSESQVPLSPEACSTSQEPLSTPDSRPLHSQTPSIMTLIVVSRQECGAILGHFRLETHVAVTGSNMALTSVTLLGRSQDPIFTVGTRSEVACFAFYYR